MQEKSRVGLILMRSYWSGCDQSQAVVEQVEADAREIVERLEERYAILGPWVVDAPETLQACQRALVDAQLDLVVLVYQTIAEDARLFPLLEAVGNRPLVLWCYLPWRHIPRQVAFSDVLRSTGPVGAFGALGTLRNMRAPFLFTWGAPDDPRLLRDLDEASRAARVRQALREARFGVLPSRNEEMQSTIVDVGRLMSELGPEVQPVPVSELERAAGEISEGQVESYLAHARRCMAIDPLPRETLHRAARVALGLADIAAQRKLDLLAVNDTSADVYNILRLRPALYPTLKTGPGAGSPQQTIYVSEADLGAATANFILNRLTGSPTMFLEFWYWDEALNQVVGGHGGLQNPALAAPGQAWISRDYEICPAEEPTGAQMQMIARPGRVTIFQLRGTPDGWQAIAASGVCLEERPMVEGYPHAVLRLDTSIEHFLNHLADTGCTQHWVMAYGSVMHELEAFCEMEQIPLEKLGN